MRTFNKVVLLFISLACLCSCNNTSKTSTASITKDVTAGVTDYSKAENWLNQGNGNNFDVDVFYL